jgi:hypothetical protein
MRVKRGMRRSEKKGRTRRRGRSGGRTAPLVGVLAIAPVLVEEGVWQIVYDAQSEWQGYTHR